jgi:hypothetical protein
VNARILGFLFLLATAFPVQAQDGVRFGVKAGVTSAELRTEDFGYEALRSLNVGVFAVVPMRGSLGALAHVDLHRKGYRVGEIRDVTNTRLGSDADFQYDYVSLLVAPRYGAALGTGGTFFYAFAGPRLDVLAADRLIATTPEGDREPLDAEALGFEQETFDGVVFGASAGLGLDLTRVLPAPLLLELRYDADVTAAAALFDRDHRFRTFSLRLGFAL